MSRMFRTAGSWRSRVWIGVGLCAFALGAAGIGWAASRATDSNVLTACVDAGRRHTLVYSASGQLHVWSDDGAVGQAGAARASGVARGERRCGGVRDAGRRVRTVQVHERLHDLEHRDRARQLRVRGDDRTGADADRVRSPEHLRGDVLAAVPARRTAPPPSLTTTTQTFVYNRHTKTYQPNAITTVRQASTSPSSSRPVRFRSSVYYTCKKVGIGGRVVLHASRR